MIKNKKKGIPYFSKPLKMEKIIQPIGTQPKYSEYFSNNQLITSKNINNITQ